MKPLKKTGCISRLLALAIMAKKRARYPLHHVVDGRGTAGSGVGSWKCSGIIRYSFDDQLPCNYHAITFRLDEKRIRNSIRMEDMRWWPEKTDPYLLTIMDITGEYDYAIGELSGDQPVVLWRGSIGFK